MTPEVKNIVVGGIQFLSNELFSGNYQLNNAFFSGSMKTASTDPFAFPGTYSCYRYANITIPTSKATPLHTLPLNTNHSFFLSLVILLLLLSGLCRNETCFNPLSGYFPDSMENLVYAMKGRADKATYDKFLGLKWFGQEVPLQFEGFNEPGNAWPYWSSPAMTYAMSLIAFSNFAAVQQCTSQ